MARAIEAVEPSSPFVAEVKATAIAGDALRCELAVHLAEPDRTRFAKDVLRDAADRSKGYMVQALARWNSYKLYDFTPARDEIKHLTKHKNEEISKWANGMMKELDPNWGKVKEDLLTETADPPKPPDL